jgi:hypothetical protein
MHFLMCGMFGVPCAWAVFPLAWVFVVCTYDLRSPWYVVRHFPNKAMFLILNVPARYPRYWLVVLMSTVVDTLALFVLAWFVVTWHGSLVCNLVKSMVVVLIISFAYFVLFVVPYTVILCVFFPRVGGTVPAWKVYVWAVKECSPELRCVGSRFSLNDSTDDIMFLSEVLTNLTIFLAWWDMNLQEIFFIRVCEIRDY